MAYFCCGIGIGLVFGFLVSAIAWMAIQSAATDKFQDTERRFLLRQLDDLLREALRNLKVRIIWRDESGKDREDHFPVEEDDISDADWWKRNKDR